MTPNRILIATHHLIEYAGSEILTLELASEFLSEGWEVHVAALLLGDPIQSRFREKGVQILDLIDDIEIILSKHYDIVWMNHAPVYYQLFVANNVKARKIIHSCLSPFESLEQVPLKNDKADIILANSPETKNVILRTLGYDDNRVVIFPNSVPKEFFKHARNNHPKTPKEIAIVTNHLAPELYQAMQILKKNKISVTHFGLGETYELITPHLLNKFDMVISIGKTVQYCFALKIPVYCYDHFGGPGWLTNDNYNIASDLNFSGRGFSKKTNETIFHEILQGYAYSLSNIEPFSRKAIEHNNLNKNITKLLNLHVTPNGQLQNREIKDIILQQHGYYLRLLKIIKSTSEDIVRHQNEIKRVKSTVSWRVTKPLRLINNIFKQLQRIVKIKKY